jgi:hypothetical protein
MADAKKQKSKPWNKNRNKKPRHGEEGYTPEKKEKKIDEGVAGVDYVQFGDDDGDDEGPKKKKLSNVAKKSGGFQKMGMTDLILIVIVQISGLFPTTFLRFKAGEH